MYSSTFTTILARPDHGRSTFAWCGYRDTANAASEIRYCSVPPRTTSTLAFRLGTALSSRAHAFFCRLCKLMQEDDGENPALQYCPYVICAIIHVYTSLPPYTTMQLPSLILQLGAFNNVRIRHVTQQCFITRQNAQCIYHTTTSPTTLGKACLARYTTAGFSSVHQNR